jgi:glycosyltransferase involved in cell wall biosynthesis
MTIWLINPYGPIPSEGWRHYRFAMMGEFLAREGHIVTWWTANFSHHFKRFRSAGWRDIPVCDRFHIRLVPTAAYRTNVSLGRLRFEAHFVRNVLRGARDHEAPDLLIGVDPPQTIGWLATKLKTRFGVPLALDVMDMWPELFRLAFPQPVKCFARPVLFPFYVLRRRNLSRADGLIALCQTYMDLALHEAPVLRTRPSAVVFNGIDVGDFSPAPVSAGDLAMPKPPGEIWAIYAGSLGANYDVDTVLNAGLALRGSRIRLLLAGDGPRRADVEHFIKTYPSANLRYLGKLDHKDLIQLYRVCDIGLCPYGPESNVAMPDKAYDYMAACLPMVNSLPGELAEMLRREDAGLPYEPGNVLSLSNALRRLASEEPERLRMARNSFGLAAEFDSKRQYLKLVKLLETLLSRG